MRRSREEDEEDDVPLHHKKPFGAGLKRKRVEFVRATEADQGIQASVPSAEKGLLASDLYASVVLGAAKSGSASRTGSLAAGAEDEPKPEPTICPVCSLPITASVRKHEASLAHQVSLEHSHPPSALDRSRMGLRTLQSQGWDPDARRGLGLGGEGVRYPVRANTKEDNLGIGAVVEETQKKKEAGKPARQLTAKERKALVVQERQRAERLQAEIYGSVDVERYLRGNGADNEV
ncbi:hypothetical protein TOPH_05391 [Tolypocladium ophioglossoides CBS 100239]|uniref:G-patch domain-containing protein n=1 Tax=Tolypocladium ophioglossoides (strain CBS 100239) TaxID=1163406 RepID=A0A0L0N7Q5_TOLOC|nr:hypothetical protein TOPH_05391 [Tolypocladium ophioglossoides CBS 100239]